MTKRTKKIDHTAEAWETGALGCDPEFVKVVSVEINQQVDEALGLQMISIRLQKELIDELKLVASFHGVGYQPLMRDALKRFANAELKKLAIEYANQKAAATAATQEQHAHPPTVHERQAA